MSALGKIRSGPLAGVRTVEFLGIGPGPHCAMLLADMGADVLRISRKGGNGWPNPIADRGRSMLEADIRSPEGKALCLAIIDKADVLLEGYRPGVMERLGFGPDDMLKRNPRLIYGRITGWGQSGPLAQSAGHDLNYIAITGALAAMGEPGRVPPPPLNLVGDFGGGSMFLAFGIAAALFERERSGRGQVIDAAIVEGVANLMHFFAGASDALSTERDANMLGGAAHFYCCYECADGRQISIGAIEPQFYAELLDLVGAPAALRDRQYDRATWPARKEALANLFVQKSRDEWCRILEGTDACFAPVLTLEESHAHPHMSARGVYKEANGAVHPTPAPHFSRTPGALQENTSADDLLKRWNVSGAP